MENPKDNAGIFVPPPFIYAALFLFSYLMQRLEPLPGSFFCSVTARWVGSAFLIAGTFLVVPAVVQFIRRRTAILPVKPATELQTGGCYAISRNPMYLGLLIVYGGLAMCFGNWWTVLMIPVLVLIIHRYLIRREEAYLQRKFGQRYLEYKDRVRRWI